MLRRVLAMATALLLTGMAAPGGVSVDASQLEAVGEDLGPEVARELDALLQREGLDPASLRVRIYWLDAENFHYQVNATFDASLPPDQIPLVATCGPDCPKAKLVSTVVTAVETKLIPPEKQRLAEPQGTTKKTTPSNFEPPPARKDDTAPKTGLQPMGWAGVGLLVAGGAAAITGGAFVGVGETRPKIDMSQIRDWRPTGYALLGTGVAMIVVGAVLLGVDRARAKKGKSTTSYRAGSLGVRF